MKQINSIVIHDVIATLRNLISGRLSLQRARWRICFDFLSHTFALLSLIATLWLFHFACNFILMLLIFISTHENQFEKLLASTFLFLFHSLHSLARCCFWSRFFNTKKFSVFLSFFCNHLEQIKKINKLHLTKCTKSKRDSATNEFSLKTLHNVEICSRILTLDFHVFFSSSRRM